MKKAISKTILKIGALFYRLGYKLITREAVILNSGKHPKHEITNYHQFFIDNINEGDSVLDIGCGNGQVALSLSKKAGKVVGIDIDKNKILQAASKNKKPNIEYITGDASNYNYAENYNTVILSNVLEHIDERVKLLSSIKNCTTSFLIRVPLITRSWVAPYLYKQGLEYRLDKTHFIEYKEDEIIEEIEQAGLKIDFFYIKWGEFYCKCSNNS